MQIFFLSARLQSRILSAEWFSCTTLAFYNRWVFDAVTVKSDSPYPFFFFFFFFSPFLQFVDQISPEHDLRQRYHH